MIVMRSIDFALRRAEFKVLGPQSPCGDDDFARVVETAESIGFNQLEMHGGKRRAWKRNKGASGSKSRQPKPTLAVADTNSVLHRWKLQKGKPVYDGTFEHHEDSVYQLSCYAALTLATFGSFGHDLLELRLAIHELCANVVEHGRQNGRAGKIHLHLEFSGDRIEGYIQDCCKPFDPFQVKQQSLPKQVENRAPRGYGLHMIQRLLDLVEYEFNDTGNRITFRKKVRE